MEFDWLNEPPHWQADDGALHMVTGDRTDFWCRTHYGFVRDTGHFRHMEASGNFSASVTFHAAYEHLYDQAGLMLRVDADTWLKTGIEYTDGGVHFSTVVTRGGFSDWSQQRIADQAAQGLTVRLTRHGEALRCQFKLNHSSWTMARLAMLPMPELVQVGMMACSPERAGLKAWFRDFNVGDAISLALHD